MSIKAMNWAWNVTGLKPNEKLVLMKLADNASDSGICWPSKEYLAFKCEISKRTADRIIAFLCDNNLISITRKLTDRGKNESNEYQLHIGQFPLFDHVQPRKIAGVQKLQGCRKGPEGVQKTSPGGAKFAPEPLYEPIEPSDNCSANAKPIEYRSAKGKILKGAIEASFEKFWDIWGRYGNKAPTADSWIKVYSMAPKNIAGGPGDPDAAQNYFETIFAAAAAERKRREANPDVAAKHAVGWLNERRWEDHADQAKTQAPKKQWFETWPGVANMATDKYRIDYHEFPDPPDMLGELIERMKGADDDVPPSLVRWHRAMKERHDNG